MPRAKKDSMYLNVKIDTSIYRRLEQLCAEAGQTKTLFVERALTAYCDSFDEQKKMLKQMEASNFNIDALQKGDE